MAIFFLLNQCHITGNYCVSKQREFNLDKLSNFGEVCDVFTTDSIIGNSLKSNLIFLL